MERVIIDDIEAEPHPMGVNRERRNVTDAVGADQMTAVHYELDPGEQFSGGLHTHHDQEEMFYVIEGTATFEYGTDGEETDVEDGEIIRFEPGEFQCGRNKSDEPVVGLALAAPGSRHNWTDLESFAPCPECDEVTSHGVEEPDEAFVIYCNECGNEMRIA
ncbi:MAG: quercetin dioxygenase-like cupin family protein [Natronomonas sp.]|jgi:quercetin dioxygenase-like cupin family protein